MIFDGWNFIGIIFVGVVMWKYLLMSGWLLILCWIFNVSLVVCMVSL